MKDSTSRQESSRSPKGLDTSISNYKVRSKSSRKQKVVQSTDKNLKNYIFSGGMDSSQKCPVSEESNRKREEALAKKINELQDDMQLQDSKNKQLDSFRFLAANKELEYISLYEEKSKAWQEQVTRLEECLQQKNSMLNEQF